VLRPLGWLLTISAAAAVACVEAKAPVWLLMIFGVICALTGVLYLGAYIYCLIRDRDALRSERYSIQKLAIQKGYGDSFIGMLPGSQAREQVAAPKEKE
jgi:hypothetical protein